MGNYKSVYGINMGRRGPDFTRCCEEVSRSIGLYTQWGQCSRKRGYGPNGDYCKQHDPAAVKTRADESNRKYREQVNKDRYKWYGRTFYDTLKLIAEGHNDARGLALETLEKFDAGRY